MEQKISFKVVGKTPLVMNNPESYGRDTGDAKKKTIPTPEDEASSKAYKMPDGSLYAKGDWFIGSLRKAAGGLKINKVSAKIVLAAGFDIPEERMPLVHPKTGKPIKEYEIYVCRAVVQRQGILRARPRIAEWSCIVNATFDDEILSPKTILQIFERAGLMIGVGDQRPGAPSTPGRFGKYGVELVDGKKK
jgi:hypothetical protein